MGWDIASTGLRIVLDASVPDMVHRYLREDVDAFLADHGLTIGDIATFHEFGTQTVPQRSFVRGWFDERQPEIQQVLKQEIGAAMKGKRPLPQALERSALRLEGSVKDRIRQHIPPPLSPVTVKRKGSSTPLIDTGQLRNAIRARVGGGEK